jgi:glutathione synthase/RimK-type ligase-like ATP-grasp enzyme
VTTIAFATGRAWADLVEDDRLVIEPLRARGVEVEAVVWDASHRYSPGDSVVIRSCWDYHHRPEEFIRWARQLEREGVALWNPAPVVEWNHDKRYLRELHAKGALVPETAWVEEGADLELASLLAERGWTKAVVKPVVSASAWRTFVTEPRTAGADEPAWRQLLAEAGAMVQPFVPEVQTQGEWSLVFFGGKFSHAVLKRPRPGDFRVQSELGGTAALVQPPPALLEEARRLLALVEEPLLFARVDGVEVNGAFVLMELELIEPALFLGADPSAPVRFADAIVSRR